MQPTRIFSLDYLRGFTALGIMLFHFSTWSFGHFNATSFLGRIGIYGVSVFYVLSGLTLFLIYFKGLHFTWQSLLSFFIKRTFRIFPLLWLVIGLTLLQKPELLDLRMVLLSVTGLFGYIEPTRGIGTGVWSIGNELVFYAFFPILLLLAKFSRYLFFAAATFLMSISIYFAFFVLSGNKPLWPQWPEYVNPFNQAILFVGGMVLGYFTRNFTFDDSNSKIAAIMLLTALLAFIFYPATGDRISLVFSWNRIAFLIFSFVICATFYLGNFQFPRVVHQPVALTGEISYGLYLFHPIVYFWLHPFKEKFDIFFSPETGTFLFLLTTFLFTFLASYLVFRFYEMPIVKAGKQLTNTVTFKAKI